MDVPHWDANGQWTTIQWIFQVVATKGLYKRKEEWDSWWLWSFRRDNLKSHPLHN